MIISELTVKFVGWRGHGGKVRCVSPNGTVASADLGSSSNYSNELQANEDVTDKAAARFTRPDTCVKL